MKFSEQWLREWVNPQLDTQQLADKITMAGLEVDAIEPVAGAFSGVLVAEILDAQPHPNADKLQVCSVYDGQAEFQVVCGAPNARPGIRVPFAQIGARLPGDFKIKKAKLRDVESFGMLCAAAELGLSEDSAGLLELAADAPLGQDLRDYLALDDQCIEVDLTPNRADCLSIAGIARDAAALTSATLQSLQIEPVAAQVDDSFDVQILDPEACPRYLGRVIRNIDSQAPSPLWLQEKLRRSGIRSIDAVVDVTNYVLLELGQPMHAFDLARLEGAIQVRMASQNGVLEKLTLLDGQEIELTPDSLVIADAKGPLALAGIMGGEQSGVVENTQDLFLEAAFFNPLTLAGKARDYGLHTDSSHRFERGVDFNLPRQAMERATQLLLDIVGGQPGPIVEHTDEALLPARPDIVLDAARVERLLGFAIAEQEIEGLLSRLGFMLKRVDAEGGSARWTVQVPSHRFDMAYPEDLIEDIGRVYGYNRLPVTHPKVALELQPQPERNLSSARLRQHLLSRDYQEAITYSFVDPQIQKWIDPETAPVVLKNPISAELSQMRTSLWGGLLRALQHNVNRQQNRVRLFELGARFLPGNPLIQEPMLAGLAAGPSRSESWASDAKPVDFFDVKGDLESLMALGLGAAAYEFSAASHPALHPGQSAQISLEGKPVGWLGALHPRLAAELDLSLPVYLFEISQAAVKRKPIAEFTPLSKFPEVRRDLALVADDSLPVAQIEANIRQHSGDYLVNLTLFDLYQGQGIESGRKSLALGLTFRHSSRTLKEEEVNDSIEKIVQGLKQAFDISLRG